MFIPHIVTTKKISKLHIAGILWVESTGDMIPLTKPSVIGGFPSQRVSNVGCAPYHNVIICSILSTFMLTSSNGNIFRVTDLCVGNSPVTGEFPSQRPMTRSFEVFFDLSPNKRLSKQSWGWWFETPSRSLWRHCNDRSNYFSWGCTTGAVIIQGMGTANKRRRYIVTSSLIGRAHTHNDLWCIVEMISDSCNCTFCPSWTNINLCEMPLSCIYKVVPEKQQYLCYVNILKPR